MKVKKLWALLSAASLCAGLLSGCTDKGNETDSDQSVQVVNDEETVLESNGDVEEFSGELKLLGPGKFTEVGPDGATDPVTGLTLPGYTRVIELFEEKYPNVKVSVEAIPWDSYQAKIQTAVSGGEVDVILHGAVVLEATEDLNAYIEKDSEIVDQLFLGTAVRHKYDDNYAYMAVTGIPATISPVLLMLDKQIFEDFGVEIPTADELTWDGLLEIAKQLTGTNPKTGEECYGIYPFKVDDTNIYKNLIAVNWARNIEGFVYHDNKADTELHFDTPESIEAIDFLNQFVQLTPPGYLEGLGNEKMATEENNVAIYMGEDLMRAYDKSVVNGVGDRFVYLPLPLTEDGSSYTSHSGDWNLAIANTSQKKDLAWEFIKFMVTDPEVQQWYIEINAVPNNREGFESYLAMDRPYMDSIKKIYDKYPADFCYTSCQYWNTSFGPSNSVLANAFGELFAGNTNAEECAKSIQKGLEEYRDSLK